MTVNISSNTKIKYKVSDTTEYTALRSPGSDRDCPHHTCPSLSCHFLLRIMSAPDVTQQIRSFVKDTRANMALIGFDVTPSVRRG